MSNVARFFGIFTLLEMITFGGSSWVLGDDFSLMRKEISKLIEESRQVSKTQDLDRINLLHAKIKSKFCDDKSGNSSQTGACPTFQDPNSPTPIEDPIVRLRRYTWKIFDEVPIVEVEAPNFINHANPTFPHLDNCLTQTIQEYCSTVFGNSLEALEESIAYAAVHTPEVMNAVDLALEKLNVFVRADAITELNLQNEKTGKPSDHISLDMLKKELSVENKAKIESKMNEIFKEIFTTHHITDAGFVGTNPEVIREVMKKGNLREKMFVLYATNWNYLGKVFPKFHFDPADPDPVVMLHAGLKPNLRKTNEISQYTSLLGGFKIDLASSPVNSESTKELGAFRYGVYAQLTEDEKLRVKRTVEERNQVVAENPTIKALASSSALIPLSERELKALKEHGLPESSTYPCISGKAYFKTQYNENSAYSRNATRANIPQIAGVSGTADLILSMAKFLGIKDQPKLELLRLGLLGWMISEKDHSSHEILSSTKSFEMPYHFSPDFYKRILSTDNSDFARRVEERQREKKERLPEDVVKGCANELAH